MDLCCKESLPSEKELTQRLVKTLYERARETLFEKIYMCLHCELVDYDQTWIDLHIKFKHDETSQAEKLFECRKCRKNINEEKIVTHLATCTNI